MVTKQIFRLNIFFFFFSWFLSFKIFSKSFVSFLFNSIRPRFFLLFSLVLPSFRFSFFVSPSSPLTFIQYIYINIFKNKCIKKNGWQKKTKPKGKSWERDVVDDRENLVALGRGTNQNASFIHSRGRRRPFWIHAPNTLPSGPCRNAIHSLAWYYLFFFFVYYYLFVPNFSIDAIFRRHCRDVFPPCQ